MRSIIGALLYVIRCIKVSLISIINNVLIIFSYRALIESLREHR